MCVNREPSSLNYVTKREHYMHGEGKARRKNRGLIIELKSADDDRLWSLYAREQKTVLKRSLNKSLRDNLVSTDLVALSHKPIAKGSLFV